MLRLHYPIGLVAQSRATYAHPSIYNLHDQRAANIRRVYWIRNPKKFLLPILYRLKLYTLLIVYCDLYHLYGTRSIDLAVQ